MLPLCDGIAKKETDFTQLRKAREKKVAERQQKKEIQQNVLLTAQSKIQTHRVVMEQAEAAVLRCDCSYTNLREKRPSNHNYIWATGSRIMEQTAMQFRINYSILPDVTRIHS